MYGSSGIIQLAVSFLAIIFSAVSLVISILAYRRSARYQDFESVPRLDVTHEDVHMGTRSFPTAFHYEAELVNRGLKPADVSRVIMDCGSDDECQKRNHHHLESRFTLPPGAKRAISFDYTWEDIDDLTRRLELSECLFFIRIQYETPSGGVSEVERPLGGFRGQKACFVHQAGERLK